MSCCPTTRIRRCEDCPMRLHGLLRDVPDEVFRRISCCMTPHRYPARQLLFIEGNPCHRLGSIRKGLVKISKTCENGKTQIIGSAGPGFLLGYEVFEDKPCQTTVETLVPTQICTTTKEEITRQIKEFPDVAFGLVRFLSHRISDLENKALQLGAFSARQRVAAQLLAATSGETDFGNQTAIQVRLTRQDIADSLGMAKETLIRILAGFADKGMVNLDGANIAILQPKCLEQLLNAAS